MLRLAVRVRREDAELVLAELLELAPSGVEECEPEPGVIEYAVYGAPGELPALPDADRRRGRWRGADRGPNRGDPRRLVASAGGAFIARSCSTAGSPCARRGNPRRRPPIDVVIDPGQAFGTGAHATTRLCLELLLTGPEPSGTLVDVGCGSGVLAIVAAQLGWGPVVALDYDPAAVAATEANAADQRRRARGAPPSTFARTRYPTAGWPWPTCSPGPCGPGRPLSSALPRS